jgi:hypothetical protein
VQRRRFFLGVLFSSWISTSSLAAGLRISSPDLGDKIEFSYSTSDGEFQLACKHWIQNEGAGDFNVLCGKGTPTKKEYSVHLVVREHPRASTTSFEVLYWVTDRNTSDPVPHFSSQTQIFTVDGKSHLREFIMSQGLENDAAQMRLKYTP